MIVDEKKLNLVLEIEDNKIFCANGDFAMGYKINYPDIYSIGESDFEVIFSDWIKSFFLLPEGSIVVKSDSYLENKFLTDNFSDKTFLQRGAKKHFKNRTYFAHQGYIFFVWTKRDTFKNKDIKNPFKFPSLKAFNKEDLELKTFTEAVKNIEQYNASSRIQIVPLTKSEIEDFELFYFNGFQKNHTGDLYAEKDRFVFDNTKIGVVSIEDEDKLPDVISTSIKDQDFSSVDGDYTYYQGFLDNLGLKFRYNHIVNQILYIDEHKKHVNNMHKNLNALKSTRRYNPSNEAGARILEGALEDIINDNNSHFIRGHINIVYWSDDEAEFQYIKQQIISVLNRLSIKPNVPSREQLKNIFYNTYYTNTSHLNNNSCFITDIRAFSAMLLNSSNYKSDESGVYLTERVFNTPVLFDFWDEKKKNIVSRNFCIVAPTGRGKSVTANFLFRQLLEQDIIIVIIDLGGSYTKFSHLLPKEDVEIFSYKDGEPLGLNPFLLQDGEQSPSALKVDELAEFIWTLIKKESDPSEDEKTSMRKIINYYYEMEEENHSWEGFYQFINRNKNTLIDQLNIGGFFHVEQFLHAGSDFVGDGSYANILRKADNSQNFIGKRLIVFELDSVADNKLLLTIMLQVISEAIQKTVWKDRKSKGIVFFDEFAKQLEFPNVFRSVKHYMEQIRKHNGGVGIVLQTINQLPDTPIGNTLIDNMQTKLFVEADDYEQSVKRLSLSSHARNQLYSLRNKHEGEGYRYSEVYIDRNNYRNVYRIELSKEELIAYQTEGVLHTEILERYERLGDMEKAITEYLEEKQ